MSTIRQQIINGFVAALNTNRPGGIPTATGDPADPTAVQPALAVFPMKDPARPVNGTSPVVGRNMVLRFQAVGVSGGGLTAVQAVDPLVAWITLNVGHQRLGGLVNSALPLEDTFQYEQFAEGSVCCVLMDFHIQYQHNVTNAESRV